MISPDKRKAIYLLHNEGIGIRKIAKQLKVDRGTIKRIIEQKGIMPESNRKDKIVINDEILIKLYNDCNGWIQRMHEILTEEEDINIGYSTLTMKIRELGLGKTKNKRSYKVPDKAGEEMQHDTSPYKATLGDKRVLLCGSLLYFRYSKIRYLKFYYSFDRFKMKCFLHEALSFWGFSAGVCIIDNTNLARLRGTGKNAIIAPEMEQFSKQYGFNFICHEVGHANRKAGNERGFFTITSNFFAGRKFENLEDINNQAFQWATQRSANRPTGKTRLIPVKAFEYEKPYLNKLPAYIEPPYLVYERITDQYGFAVFESNYYWIPGTKRYKVKILRYDDHIKIFHNRQLLGQYKIPAYGIKNKEIIPDGQAKPKYRPKFRKKPTAEEEKILRNLASEIDEYLNFAIKQKGPKGKHRFIRQLYNLHNKLSQSLMLKSIKRALTYRILDINAIERIAILLMKEEIYDMPYVENNEEFKNCDAFQQGRFSKDVDLSYYDEIMEDNDDE